MLLQRLTEYADRLRLPPELYAEAPVRYLIDLDHSGRLLNPTPQDTADPASPRTRRGTPRLVPQVRRTVAITPLLLADNAEYSLGLAREASRPQRVAACHAAYLELLAGCAEQTGATQVAAVLSFLRRGPLAELRLPEGFDPGATITFRVDGVFPVDLPAVQAFWAAHHGVGEDQDTPVLQCVVCGQQRPARSRLTGALKRVPGGQTSGTSLISANQPAFESYGLKASLVAPTCSSCGERFTKAANALLADQRTHLVLGGTAFVFWTREEIGFSILDYFHNPDPEQVRTLLRSVKTGELPPEVDATAFFATALSGSGGRAAVRDWIDTTVGQVRANLASWFQRQRLADPGGREGRPLGIYALAACTTHDPRTRLAPTVPHKLIRTALTGGVPPWGLLYQAVRRNRAERAVTYPRAALIKLVLLGHDPHAKEASLQRLEPDHPSPAYQCGRLLAVLQEIQRLAVPNIKATIVDRFYGTASTAPASVYGVLVRGAQPHLAKLQRDKPPAHHALQRRLEDVFGSLDGFPATLSLKDQGLFALGYYHQRAFDRAQARAARERREAGPVPAIAAEQDQVLPPITELDDEPDEEEHQP